MKKYIVALSLVLALTLMSTQVFAYGGGCNRGGKGRGANCPAMQQEPVDQEAFQKFLDATKDLRRQLVGDRAELRAMMLAETPDPKAARAMALKINDTQEAIKAKADEFKVPYRGKGMGMGMGKGNCAGGGCGKGQGKGQAKGKGRGGCPYVSQQ